LHRYRTWLLLAAAICFAVVVASMTFNGSGDRSAPDVSDLDVSDEPAFSNGEVKKTLRLATNLPPSEFALLEQIVEQFRTSRPSIDVRLENLPERDAYARLKRAAQLGEAPDIMLLDNDRVSEFAALGYLQPVDSLLTTDLQAQQMEQAFARVKWNGYLWGVPKDIDLYVIAYNAARLGEWGAAPPASSEDLIALQRTLHNPDEGKFGIYFDPGDPYAFAAVVRSLGGGRTMSKAYPLKLSDANVLKAAESFLYAPTDSARAEQGQLAQSFPQAGTSWRPWDLLAQGKLAGYVTSFSDWRQHTSRTLTMAALPLPKGENVWDGTWLSGTSFVISARTAYGREAFDLIRELVSPDAALKLWKEAGVLPAQRSVYASGINTDPAVVGLAAFIDRDAGAPVFPQRGKQWDALAAQLELLWKEGTPLQTFAEKTEAEWERIRPSASVQN
jgi:ABC-type glycerol-3-phosphate transport system substrate-binding protein